jgi:iron complex transport system permease protein
MKHIVDVARLEADGVISGEQAAEIRKRAGTETANLAINTLSTIGIMAVVGGIVVLKPDPTVGAVLGFLLAAAGLALGIARAESFGFLGGALTVIGALIHCGAVGVLADGNQLAFAYAVLVFAACGIALRHGFLTALAVFALAGLLGSSTGYWHGSYGLWVREATATVVIFAVVVALAFTLGPRLKPAYARLARIAGLLAFIWVNFGFWVGSLFGDRPGFTWLHADLIYGSAANRWKLLREARDAAFQIPDVYFAGAWALALVGLAIWAGLRNQRGMMNAVVVFGAILFYTQWFENLRTSPLSVILAGVIAVLIAFGLWRYNQRPRETDTPPTNAQTTADQSTGTV